jgi:hypothetical protein
MRSSGQPPSINFVSARRRSTRSSSGIPIDIKNCDSELIRSVFSAVNIISFTSSLFLCFKVSNFATDVSRGFAQVSRFHYLDLSMTAEKSHQSTPTSRGSMSAAQMLLSGASRSWMPWFMCSVALFGLHSDMLVGILRTSFGKDF